MEFVTGLGVFDLPGGAFLALYGALFVVAITASFVLARVMRPEGRAIPESDPDALAYLTGGRARMAESLVASLLEAKALMMEGSNRLRIVAQPSDARPAGRAILALPSPASWAAVARAARAPAAAVEQKLIRSGLMIDKADMMPLRLWQAAPFLLLIGFGAIKWQIGVARDKPVGFLAALLVVTLVLALIRMLAVDRRTKGGLAALSTAKERFERLRRAPAAGEAALAVALFGTTVLAGSALSDFHRMRAASGGDAGVASDSGSSDGSSGGGCGGGGCGGCGS
ncbi:MAG: TIGR04222 domain-containing membrane protein [Sphingomonas sp.]|uniref:TIGR04222 domain-containing membrane protein n=1 Tax=Sphingomonas sp. TaxID=28214 RepID=UPI0035A943DC|nr:TIGR04222 domain-containing membrane protein [Sphingomonas sp.]